SIRIEDPVGIEVEELPEDEEAESMPSAANMSSFLSVTGDFYVYRKSTYARDAAEANRLRGVRGDGSYNPADVNSTATAANRNANKASSKKAVASAPRKVHKVKKGETLYRIATKYGVSVEQLRKLNGLGKNANIRPGQLVRYS
ncbi:MAG: LysM peptidoglycan-binding domain-containing protein, partial [Prevotella sp.]|nr:LysM peptidoglycan-binding domain-containing protein [Prevotella sp.]